MGTQHDRHGQEADGKPARADAPGGETRPEDLHIAEELPPPMPELADRPAGTADVLRPSLCPLPDSRATPAPAAVPPARTSPEDLHIAEELPPPMPELADKPKR